MTAEKEAYVQLTDVLGIPRNDCKDAQETADIVFGLEIDKSCFTAHLQRKKLEKATRDNAKVLGQKSVSFIDMQ